MPRKTQKSKFDPDQQFDSPDEAVVLILKQPVPLDALKAIVWSNIEAGEYGFASEVVAKFGQS